MDSQGIDPPPARAGEARAHDLRRAIDALESQRDRLGDTVAELALAPLRQLLARAEAEAPQLRRGQVTVLFADIVDSTALAGRLDAEDVLQVFGRMLERAASCVQARGGRVLRYTGDGLKAGFGTRGTREDDAAQAVHAGLDILAAAREHAAWVAREHGVEGFALRVGVHTGEVALGAGFEADNTLTGETVNIAARMEQAAPPGGLRISAATFAHVRGQFDVDRQPPLALKGVEAPQQTWLVTRARPRDAQGPGRGVGGVAARMVGRSAELRALQDALDQVRADGRFLAVTVVAEAGLGKSRLLAEFAAWRRAGPGPELTLAARATPQSGTQSYALLRDLVAGHAQVRDGDSLDEARAKLEHSLLPLFATEEPADVAEGHTHLLGHLIGFDWRHSRHVRGTVDDARQLRNRALHAASLWVRRLAARGRGPVVIQLEDLHWADTESLAWLDHLADVNRDLPVLLLGSSRPSPADRETGEPAPPGRHRHVALGPLDPAASRELARALLQPLPAAPDDVLALLTARAEGNPYFMEELAAMLLDGGAALHQAPSRLPTTLTGVLQARLDSLPPAHRRALQQASVVGAVFWDQALDAVDPAATEALPALVRRGMTLPREGDDATGLREYAFQHQLLQQVTYGTVLKRDRREGHARVARWLTGLGGLRARDVLGLAAEHFELAGDAGSACEYHARAAEQAAQRLAHERVLDHVRRALALLGPQRPEQADLRWRLLSAREQTWFLQGRRAEQAADLEAMAAIADALNDDRRRAHAALRASLRAMRMADWPEQVRLARHAMACAERAGDHDLRLQAMRLVANGCVSLGDLDGGHTMAQQGLAQAREHGLPGCEAAMLSVLSIVAGARNDMVGALELNQRILEVRRASGDRAAEGIAQANLGGRWLSVGLLAPARAGLEAALEIVRTTGDRVVQASVLNNLSTLEARELDGAAACRHAQQARELAAATQARDIEALACICLGDAELVSGRPAAARAAYAQAHALAVDLDDVMQHDAAAGLAQAALAEGDTAAATGWIGPLVDALLQGSLPDGADELRIGLVCHQALAATGDPRAHACLTAAHDLLMDCVADLPAGEMRTGFLQNVSEARGVTAAWAAWQARGTP